MPEAVIDLPDEYTNVAGVIKVKHEEEAVVWLWAFRELFPWDSNIEWLYTPVVGNSEWPGDLWGVDEHGELLIIECKQQLRLDDPYIDFVEYHDDNREELSAAHWKEKFLRHLKDELSYPDGVTKRAVGRTGGILPRSNKRDHIRRWPQLADRIDSHIRSPRYRSDVLSYLDAREKRPNPTPYYFSLIIVADTNKEILSVKARDSEERLRDIVGDSHVRAVSAMATRISESKVRIEINGFGID